MDTTVGLNLNDVPELVASAFCPAFFVGCVSWLVGMVVFRPLYAKGLYVPPNTRFRIVDIIILLVWLQLAGAGTALLLGFGDDAFRYSAALMVCLLVAFWWFTGVRMLAKARVENGTHRWQFLAICLPLGYLATLGIVASPFSIVLLVMLVAHLLTGIDDSAVTVLGISLLALVSVAVIITAKEVYRFSEKIVKHAHDEAARREGIEFGPVYKGVGTPPPALLPSQPQQIDSSGEIVILDSPEP